MSPRRIDDYLQDILDAIVTAREFIAGITVEEFESDRKTIFAVTRAIEIVGEATKQIPTDVREKYPQIPWKSVAGMRDKLIHQYFGVNVRILWDTVQQDFPTFQPIITQMLEDLSNSDS
ncbi:MAG: DUF86 domain-containing protein [Cyanobacteria bacterium P01_E01_bin.42]